MNVNLTELAKEIHAAAVEKGFWDVEDALDKHCAKMISELGEIVQADRLGILYEIERDGAKPEGVVAELADFVMMALDVYVHIKVNVNHFVGVIGFDEYCAGVGAEVADRPAYSLALLLDMALNAFMDPDDINDIAGAVLVTTYGVACWARSQGFDLWQIIRQKMEYNKSRPRLHGRAY